MTSYVLTIFFLFLKKFVKLMRDKYLSYFRLFIFISNGFFFDCYSRFDHDFSTLLVGKNQYVVTTFLWMNSTGILDRISKHSMSFDRKSYQNTTCVFNLRTYKHSSHDRTCINKWNYCNLQIDIHLCQQVMWLHIYFFKLVIWMIRK